jgi:hypothetical protein
MNTFKNWIKLKEAAIPSRPDWADIPDEDWQHQYTAGNVETIINRAMEDASYEVQNILAQTRSAVYERLYPIFSRPEVDHDKVEKMARALFMQELKKKLGGQ